MRITACLVLAGLAAGCITAADAGDDGRMSLSLKTTSTTSGLTYRLRYGDLTLTGGGRTVVFHTEDHLDDETINATLPAGTYALSLASGWSLERTAADGTVDTVQATLESQPLSVAITAGGFSDVKLRFRTTGVVIPANRGDLGISIAVNDEPTQAVTVGFPTYVGSSESKAPFKGYAQPFTITQQTTLRELGIIGNGSGVGIQMAIYLDGGNRPGHRVFVSPTVPGNSIPTPTTIQIPDQTLSPGTWWLAVTGASYMGRVPGNPVLRCDTGLLGGGLPPDGAPWNCQQNAALNLFASGISP